MSLPSLRDAKFFCCSMQNRDTSDRQHVHSKQWFTLLAAAYIYDMIHILYVLQELFFHIFFSSVFRFFSSFFSCLFFFCSFLPFLSLHFTAVVPPRGLVSNHSLQCLFYLVSLSTSRTPPLSYNLFFTLYLTTATATTITLNEHHAPPRPPPLPPVFL